MSLVYVPAMITAWVWFSISRSNSRMPCGVSGRGYENYLTCGTNQQIIYKRQEILDNIGLCLLQGNNPHQALLFFDSALSVVRRIATNTQRTKNHG